MSGFHNDADARERIPKESSPCRNCGLLIIYTGQGRHPCAYCGHKEPTCVGCGQVISNPSLIRLGSTSCHDCPPTTRYPMRFTHP